VNRNNEGTVLLLCPTSTFQPVWLGRPYHEYKNSSQLSYPVCCRS